MVLYFFSFLKQILHVHKRKNKWQIRKEIHFILKQTYIPSDIKGLKQLIVQQSKIRCSDWKLETGRPEDKTSGSFYLFIYYICSFVYFLSIYFMYYLYIHCLIYLFIYLFIHLFLFVYIWNHLFPYLFCCLLYLFIHLLIYLFTYWFIYLLACLFTD